MPSILLLGIIEFYNILPGVWEENGFEKEVSGQMEGAAFCFTANRIVKGSVEVD